MQNAAEVSALGAGPVRHHPGPAPYIPSPPQGFENIPGGADIVSDRDLIRRQFPFIAEDVVAMLHVRRAGWLNSQQLGQALLAQAQACGLRLRMDRVAAVTVKRSRVEAVRLRSDDEFSTRAFVIAAGPYLSQVAAMLGLDLPVFNELHGKVAFKDYLGIVPREAPLMIWNDALRLPWTAAERQALAALPETRRLLDEFPAGVHFRTRGEAGDSSLLVIWTYDRRVQEPVWPPTFDAYYPEVLLRGVARIVPGLSAYYGQGSKACVDGGYYCKTRENLPLVGPLPVEGAFVIGALSGFGIMGSQAAGELLAAHVAGAGLPDYAPAFLLERYQDPAYKALVESWQRSGGQL
jgi:glycine/D-amino acid oxidase-like deaminating enzyme